jgi:hypothetical protein
MILGATLALTTVAILVPAAPAQREGGKTTEPEWQEVVWRKGDCVALMPGKPTATTQPTKDKIDVHYMVVEIKPGAYAMSYSVIPVLKGANQETITKFLDGGRDGAVGKNKLVKEDKITHGTYQGREILVELPASTFTRSQVFIVEDRIYHLLVLGPKDMVSSKDADKFFESFKLLR